MADAAWHRDYRAKRKTMLDALVEQHANRGAALNRILAELEGNEKTLAVKLRQIASEGLSG